MEPKRITLKIPPGLYRTGTNAQSQGRWFDGQLVRFWENTRRPVGGWRRFRSSATMPNGSAVVTPMGGGGAGGGAAIAPIPGIVRRIIAWRIDGTSAGSSAFRRNAAAVAIGSTEGLAIMRGGRYYDITPADFEPGREHSTFADTLVYMGGDEEIFTENGWRYHVYTNDGNFEVFASELEVQMILVAGGGGRGVHAPGPLAGGGLVSGYGGGGGAGAAQYYAAITLTEGAHSIVVGVGGAIGVNGEDSTGLSYVATGGGRGGSDGAGASGGCGGGGGSPPYPSDDGLNPPYAPYDDAKYDHVAKLGGAGNAGGNGGASGDNDPGSFTYVGGSGGGGGMGGNGSTQVLDGAGMADGGPGTTTVLLAGLSWHDFGAFSLGGGGNNPAAEPGNGAGATTPAQNGIVIIRYYVG